MIKLIKTIFSKPAKKNINSKKIDVNCDCNCNHFQHDAILCTFEDSDECFLGRLKEDYFISVDGRIINKGVFDCGWCVLGTDFIGYLNER